MEGLSKLSVLVVDDNRQMRAMLSAILTAAGVGRVIFAANGAEALRILKQTPVDVAFVDYEMPVMNGLEFIREVRGPESWNRFLPLVMLTGHANRSTLSAAMDGGVTEFLCKPVRTTDVLLRLEAVINRPRPFVEVDGFFGPDRRRRREGGHAGMRRRASDLRTSD